MTESIRVLHIDDEPDFVDLAADLLEQEDDGLDVLTATCAEDGLDRLAENAIDCVVSDYQMPGTDGLEFLEAVREEYPDLPFILFTGKGSEEIASEAISAGVDDYLQKGGGTDRYTLLSNRIRNVVEGYRAERTAQRSRERLREVIDLLPYPLSVTERAEEYVIANEELAAFHGMTVEELEGASIRDVLSPGEYESYREDAATVLESETEMHVPEVEVTDAEGETRLFEPRMLPFDHPDAEQAVLSIVDEVTAQRERERQLKAERDRFATLFENLPNPVVHGAIDEDGVIVRAVNPAFEETFGYCADDIECEDLYELVLPDDSDEEPEELNRRLIEQGEFHGIVERSTVEGVRAFRVDVTLRNPRADVPEGYAIYTPVSDLEEASGSYPDAQ